MKVKELSEEFGSIQIRPVKIVKRKGIYLGMTDKTMHSGALAEALTGKYKGEIIVYPRNTEHTVEVAGQTLHLINIGNIMAIIALDKDEEVIDPVIVDKDFGLDKQFR